MVLIAIIGFGITLLQLPIILSYYRNTLNKKLLKFNHRDRIMLFTSIMSIGLAITLVGLAIAQFVNSVPTLFYIQTLPAIPMNYAFQNLMIFGIVSGIICSILGYNLLRVNLKELRIVLS